MTARDELIDALSRRIGAQKLVWFGTRGIDAIPLLALGQFEECFGLTAPLGIPGITGRNLEELTGRRVDLDTYDVDLDPAPELIELRRDLLATLSEQSVVIAYRPSRFLSSIQFARLSTVVPAFLFQEEQAVFEHKPWVETHLRAQGVRTIPWEYVADEQHAEVLRKLHDGPLILRPSKGSGGVGLVRVADAGSIDESWPRQAEAFVSVAPFIDPVIPVNVSGCVGAHGEIALHSPSVQLIGIPSCTGRPFGYCGNDYGAIRSLDRSIVQAIDDSVGTVGHWLADRGSFGAFGVDLLVHDGVPLFTEVNARFQGCSLLGSEVDRRLELPDVHLEHVAAHLGTELPARPRLVDQVDATEPMVHVVVHNRSTVKVRRRGPAAPDIWPAELTDITSAPGPEVEVEPEAALFRLVLDGSVTENGFSISPALVSAIDEILARFDDVPELAGAATRGSDA